MIKALIDAGTAFKNQEYLNEAENVMRILLKELRTVEQGLFHNYKKGKATIEGFLEDYCFVIEALIALYASTSKEIYLQEAKSLLKYTITNFYNAETGIFYFTSNAASAQLITRKYETQDNVIPASNSVMANNLFKLGILLENEQWKEMSKAIVKRYTEQIINYGSGYSNYAALYLDFLGPFYEVAVTGLDSKELAAELNKHYLPNSLICFATEETQLPLLKDRFNKDKNAIYVCFNNTCQAPVYSVNQALELLKV
jgi:uncharacterized protein